jgi:hypothetical protein
MKGILEITAGRNCARISKGPKSDAEREQMNET